MDLSNYTLVFNEDFASASLSLNHWVPYYLPQWSSRELSKPRYLIQDGLLSLRIEADQQPWCPEFNGDVKCSSIQTGLFAGTLGSSIGQHSFFNPLCRVREEQAAIRKYVPQYGYIEMRAKFAASASDVVALWMIGYEDRPERSAELCIMEIKGWQLRPKYAKIGMGLRQFNDPKIVTDFTEDSYPIDVREFHTYAVCWTRDKVVLYIDDFIAREINQSPDYPMQLMLGIYELPEQLTDASTRNYPKEFVVDYVRGYEVM